MSLSCTNVGYSDWTIPGNPKENEEIKIIQLNGDGLALAGLVALERIIIQDLPDEVFGNLLTVIN